MLGFASAGFRRLRLVLWLFPSCVWDVLWYRLLVKKVRLLEQNRNFPKRRWVRSRNGFLSSGGLVASVVTKKLFWELPQISLSGTKRVFCSNAESRFSCASFPTPRLVLWLFTSCVWDVLRYRILKKTAFDFFWGTWSALFWIVYILLKVSLQIFENSRAQCHQNQLTFLLKWRWGQPKVFALSCAWLVFLVVNEKIVVRSSSD